MLLLILLLLAPSLHAQSVTVQVDAAKSLGPLRTIWRYFGYDEPNFTYMPDGKKLLSELSALSSRTVYVRTHNLLTSGDGTPALKWGSTNVYTEDADGHPVYDWKIVDRIFDTFHQAGVKPLVELGFMLAGHHAPEVEIDPVRRARLHVGDGEIVFFQVELLQRVLGDFVFQGRPLGINAVLFATTFVAALAVLLRVGRVPLHQGRRLMAAPLLLFTALLAWHDSLLLVAIDLFAIAGDMLLLSAVVLYGVRHRANLRERV